MADRNIVVCTTSPIGGALPHRNERRMHTLRYMPWPMSKMHRLGGTFYLLEIKWGSFPLKYRKKVHLNQKGLELAKPTIRMRKRRARNKRSEIREYITQRRVED